MILLPDSSDSVKRPSIDVETMWSALLYDGESISEKVCRVMFASMTPPAYPVSVIRSPSYVLGLWDKSVRVSRCTSGTHLAS